MSDADQTTLFDPGSRASSSSSLDSRKSSTAP